MDITTKPLHHAKLLEVISKIYEEYKKDENIKFYVTGGAAAAYLLPEEGLPINDIDCVCIINKDITPEKYKTIQKNAIKTAMEITRSVLDSVRAEELGSEINGGPLSITKLPYMMNNTSVPENYRFPIAESSKSSPFTGKIYKDSRFGIIVLSVTQRTAGRAKLMDIAFPLLSYDEDNYKVKWEATTRMVNVMGYAIPVLSPESLRRNQQYAANRTPNTNTTGVKERRLGRVALLSTLIESETATIPPSPLPDVKATTPSPPLPVVNSTMTPPRLPVVKSKVVNAAATGGANTAISASRPPMIAAAMAGAATGGAGTASSGGGGAAAGSATRPPMSVAAATGGATTSVSYPAPALTVIPTTEGRARLYDYILNDSWYSIGYNSKKNSFLFTSGFEGPYGNYWKEPRSPTGYSWGPLSTPPLPPTPWPIPPFNPEANPWFTILTDGRKFMQDGSWMVYHSVGYNEINGFIFNDETYGHPGHYYRHKTFKNPKTGYLQTIRWHL